MEETREEIDVNDPKYTDLDRNEVEEYVEVEKWRKKLADGEDIPDEVREYLEVTDIDIDKLLLQVPDRQLSSWIRVVMPKVSKFTITTDDAIIEISYSEDSSISNAIGYPVKNGERLWLHSIDIPDEDSEIPNDGVFII